eukprot:240274-Alexandrium_andersonii.AAC.1
MSASLVGSEMCIRDSLLPKPIPPSIEGQAQRWSRIVLRPNMRMLRLRLSFCRWREPQHGP